jgi:hypothetical protein
MARRDTGGEGAGGYTGLRGSGLLKWLTLEFLELAFPHGTLIVRTANHRTLRQDWGDPRMIEALIMDEADAVIDPEPEEVEVDDEDDED